MAIIDLEEYPGGTEEILMALWEHEQEYKNDELQGHWMKRRMLATRTSLNKQQVRYRLKQLVEDDYVTEDTVTEHNQRVTYYALPPDGKESAKAIGEIKDVLGEIPEEFEKQDILMLTYELATARAEAEIGRANADSSVVIQRLNKIDKKINKVDDKIEKIDKQTDDKFEYIDETLGDFRYWIEVQKTYTDVLDERFEGIREEVEKRFG